MCFLATVTAIICYLQRTIYYTALDEMLYVFDNKGVEHNVSAITCPVMISTNDIDLYRPQGDFVWDQTLVHALKQAFHVGYLIAPIPAGMMADFYGGKVILVSGFLLSTIVTIFYPILAKEDPYFFMMGRFFHGVGQGMVWPGSAVIMAQWSPLQERSLLLGIYHSGRYAGVALNPVLVLFLEPFNDTWEAKLFTAGIISILWIPVLVLLAYSEPAVCPHISDEEKAFVESSIEGLNHQGVLLYPFVPWKEIFQSPPFLSLLLLAFGSGWMYYSVVNQFQDYMTDVLRITPKLAASMMTLIMCQATVSSVFFGFVSDWAINNKLMTRTTNRKLFGFLGDALIVPLLFLALLVGCNSLIVAILYTGIFYLQGMTSGTTRANHIDLSPQHAGVTNGVITCVGSLSAMFMREVFSLVCDEAGRNMKLKGTLVISPPNPFGLDCLDARFAWEGKIRSVLYQSMTLITWEIYMNFLIHNKGNPDRWWFVHSANSFVVVICLLPYLWFGSSNVQPWNYSHARALRLRTR